MYEKQSFQPEEVLSAEQLNHIEDGITKLETELGNVKIELEEVKKHGSDVKEKLAAVITEKGVETASTDSFDVIINNAKEIQTGISLTQVIETTTTTSDCGDIKTVVTHEAYVE